MGQVSHIPQMHQAQPRPAPDPLLSGTARVSIRRSCLGGWATVLRRVQAVVGVLRKGSSIAGGVSAGGRLAVSKPLPKDDGMLVDMGMLRAMSQAGNIKG